MVRDAVLAEVAAGGILELGIQLVEAVFVDRERASFGVRVSATSSAATSTFSGLA